MNDGSRRDFLRGTILTGAALSVAVIPGVSRMLAGPSRDFLDAVRVGALAEVTDRLERDPGLVHSRDEEGRSAFALALLAHHKEIADLLRERGHRPDLHESALALDWERVDSIAPTAPGVVNQDHPIGGTAMLAAAAGGAGRDIWRVFRYAGDPNADPRGAEGFTALRAALDYPDLATAENTAAALLSNGARPDLPQPDGRSALHVAAERGSMAIVEILLNKGADVSARDARGRSAIELAAAAGQSATQRMLADAEAIPRDSYSSREAYDFDGKPYVAPDLSSFDAMKREIVVGNSHSALEPVREAVGRHPQLAHATATTTERAVEAAAHMGRVDIVDFLLEHGAPYSLPTAVVRNDIARARALIQQDPARIHERGAHDFALLWYSVISRATPEMAAMLLSMGVEVEQSHWMGTTALHFAAMSGDTELIQLFVEHGADVNRVGRKFSPQGETPLQLAMARERTEAAKLLRDRGAR